MLHGSRSGWLPVHYVRVRGSIAAFLLVCAALYAGCGQAQRLQVRLSQQRALPLPNLQPDGCGSGDGNVRIRVRLATCHSIS